MLLKLIVFKLILVSFSCFAAQFLPKIPNSLLNYCAVNGNKLGCLKVDFAVNSTKFLDYAKLKPKEAYEQWKKTYVPQREKSFRSFSLSQDQRLKVWQKNLDNCIAQNKIYADQKIPYRASLTILSDLTPQEYITLLGTKEVPQPAQTARRMLKKWPSLNPNDWFKKRPKPPPKKSKPPTHPAAWDWREMKGVPEVENQGSCGNCWAFSTASSVEAAVKIKYKNEIDVSEQQLVECAEYDEEVNHCKSGNFLVNAFAHMSKVGITSEAAYPLIKIPEPEPNGFVSKDKCKDGNYILNNKYVQSLEYGQVKYDHDWLTYQVSLQPVVASVCSYGKDIKINSTHSVNVGKWGDYSKEVMPDHKNKTTDHAILIVGYGYFDNSTKQFSKTAKDYYGKPNDPVWVIQNSWGEDWGYDGYLYLYRDTKWKSGKTTCGLGYALYPIVNKFTTQKDSIELTHVKDEVADDALNMRKYILKNKSMYKAASYVLLQAKNQDSILEYGGNLQLRSQNDPNQKDMIIVPKLFPSVPIKPLQSVTFWIKYREGSPIPSLTFEMDPAKHGTEVSFSASRVAL